jgi:hypothetical protein
MSAGAACSRYLPGMAIFSRRMSKMESSDAVLKWQQSTSLSDDADEDDKRLTTAVTMTPQGPVHSPQWHWHGKTGRGFAAPKWRHRFHWVSTYDASIRRWRHCLIYGIIQGSSDCYHGNRYENEVWAAFWLSSSRQMLNSRFPRRHVRALGPAMNKRTVTRNLTRTHNTTVAGGAFTAFCSARRTH